MADRNPPTQDVEMRQVLKYFRTGEHTCPWWFGYSFDNPVRQLVHRPVNVLGDLVEEGDKVADVGCGGGHFSLGLAELVGDTGRVLAIDVQERMLERGRNRAKRRGLDQVMEFRLCTQTELGLDPSLDFILAFWMAHEVPDQPGFFSEIRSALKCSGRLLVAEPFVHVTRAGFQGMTETALAAGLEVVSMPRVRFSRAAVFSPTQGPGGGRPYFP